MEGTLAILLFAAVCLLLPSGFPIAFVLAGTSLAFALLGAAFGAFELRTLAFFPQRMFTVMTNDVLVAVPLFIFMGLMLERSRIAEDLLLGMARLFGRLRGGLALSVVVVGALLAASTGIIGATVVSMGLIALPVMLRSGYDRRLACGVICAAGTLGQIIPPSIVLVFLGDLLTYANQQALLAAGHPTGRSVGVAELFAGALLPGLLLVAVYAAWVSVVAWRRPDAAPSVAMGDSLCFGGTLHALLVPVCLIVAVLGSILGGVATPTEAAAIGALGATGLAGQRAVPRARLPIWMGALAGIALIALNAGFDLRLGRAAPTGADQVAIVVSLFLLGVFAAGIFTAFVASLKSGSLLSAAGRTARLSAMVFALLLGASLFTLVFRGLGGEDVVADLFAALPGGLPGGIAFTMALMFVMGFFLDFIEIVLIVVPTVAPVLITIGADPVWLGVMMAVNLQTSFLTPPFGFALFYLRGVASAEISTGEIWRGALPFVCLQLLALVAVASYPPLATWLPARLSGR